MLSSIKLLTQVIVLFLMLLACQQHQWPKVLASSDGVASPTTDLEDLPDISPVEPIGDNEQRCQSVNTPFCAIENYRTIVPFKNSFGHRKIGVAALQLHHHIYLFKLPECGQRIQLFLCSLYLPCCPSPGSNSQILDDTMLMPCRSLCEKSQAACQAYMDNETRQLWETDWSCSKFPTSGVCVDFGGASMSANSTYDSTRQPSIPMDSQPLQPSTKWSHSINIQRPTTNLTLTGQCDHGEFDCQVKPEKDKSSVMCISTSFVCNGVPDCPIDDGALDEANCPKLDKLCSDGELSCDDKCLPLVETQCNGKVDCSSGIDEQNCDAHIVNLLQSILCIFALCSLIYLMIRFIRVKERVIEDYSDDIVENKIEDHLGTHENLTEKNPHHHRCDKLPDIIAQSVGSDTMNQLFNHNSEPLSPIYNTIAPSVMTRSDYEILAEGGYSGQASVYASYGPFYDHPTMKDYNRGPPEPPAAPPPTPAPQQIYSTGPQTKFIDIYANMNDLHKLG